MASRKALKATMLVLIALVLVAQIVPVSRENPPVTADFDGDLTIKAVLRKSCYDCHSNETAWPWYGYVAPVSWLVASDVNEARGKLNFSDWGHMPSDKQADAAGEAWEEVEKGKMPLRIYLVMHSDAKMSDADRAILKTWATETAAGGSHSGEREAESER